jgi:hypothetical protein
MWQNDEDDVTRKPVLCTNTYSHSRVAKFSLGYSDQTPFFPIVLRLGSGHRISPRNSPSEKEKSLWHLASRNWFPTFDQFGGTK